MPHPTDTAERVRIALDAGDGGVPIARLHIPIPMNGDAPPTRILLFHAGANRTTKGIFRFTPKSAEQVMAEYATRGIKRSGDYEHASLVPAAQMVNPAEQGRASCRYDLAIHEGPVFDDSGNPTGEMGPELWAENIAWTPEATRQLVAKERLYYSPAFDTVGGEVVRYANLALTNDPATYDQVPLVAAKDTPMLETYKAGPVAYEDAPVVEGAWDADAATARARKSVGIEGPDDLQDAKKRVAYAKFFAYVRGDGTKLGDYLLPHHDIRDGKFVTVKAGVIAAGNAIQGARGGVDIPAADLPAVKAHLAQHYHQWGAKAPWEPQESKTMAKFGEHVAARMKALGIDHKALADKMEMDPDDLKKMVDAGDAGEMTRAHKNRLRKLARSLKTPVAKLRALHDGDGDDDYESDQSEEMKALRAEAEECKTKAKKAEDDMEEMRAKLAAANPFGAKLTAAVTLTGKPDQGAALDEALALAGVGKQVISLTGKASAAEALATVQAKFTAAEQVTALSARVEAAETQLKQVASEKRTAEFDGVVDQAKRDRKLTPAMLAADHDAAKFIALCRANEKDGLVSLRAYVAALPAQAAAASVVEATPEQLAAQQVTLSAEDSKAARLLGITDEQMLASKKDGAKKLQNGHART